MRKWLVWVLVVGMLLSLAACGQKGKVQGVADEDKAYVLPARALSTEEIEEEIDKLLRVMTLEEKAGQIVQGVKYQVTPEDVAYYGLGSVLVGGGDKPGRGTKKDWTAHVTALQQAALSRRVEIPLIYGLDAIHGNDHLADAIIFPHNIGIGAANAPDLMDDYATIVAEEMKAAGVHWNFGPCVAIAEDPRWGRTYESVSTDADLVTDLMLPYVQAMQANGIMACAKHYIADGATAFGTGDSDYLLDQGDVNMTEEAVLEAYITPYQALVEAGVDTVMVSFSSINGVKMHENKGLITDVLKGQLGFNGFVISDWNAHRQIDAPTFEEQVSITINAGVDMLMEPEDHRHTVLSIMKEQQVGRLDMQRIDDAVGRILRVKFNLGLFEDPYPSTNYSVATKTGKAVAETLVQKSAVLLKNQQNALPIKPGTVVFATGPALNNIGVQCGGWTNMWQGLADEGGKIREGTTLLEGLQKNAKAQGFTVITDERRMQEADMVLIAIGEVPYAEGVGDTMDLALTGNHGLSGNAAAMAVAKQSGKPVITVLYAGRHVMIADAQKDWDALVMAYLPGTEGGGIANVLSGAAPFSGKLPMPWYNSVDDIGDKNADLLYDFGFGLIAE